MENKFAVKKALGYFTMAVICFILGFTLTLQIKSVYKINKDVSNTENTRADQIQKLYNDLKLQNDALSNQIEVLKKSNEEYRAKAVSSGNITKAMNDQLTTAEMMAGTCDVKGPGVTVIMNDSSAGSSGDDANAFVIHDVDVLQVLNELRDAGAEAISINGERILATTEVRCAGNTVSVNNNRYSTPFIIKAIGDPDKLKSALLMKNGIVDQLGQWGIQVTVETGNDILIKSYNGSTTYSYAKPVSGGTK